MCICDTYLALTLQINTNYRHDGRSATPMKWCLPRETMVPRVWSEIMHFLLRVVPTQILKVHSLGAVLHAHASAVFRLFPLRWFAWILQIRMEVCARLHHVKYRMDNTHWISVRIRRGLRIIKCPSRSLPSALFKPQCALPSFQLAVTGSRFESSP